MAAALPKLDFDAVGDAALSLASVLLPEWLGGKRQGHEWVGERKANGGLGDSWSVNLNTGLWFHGAGTEKGGDLISLYAALNRIDQGAALKEVAKMVGVSALPVKRLARSAPPELPALPIPIGAPPLRPHPKFGAATAVYRYGDSFAIARYDHADGKTFAQFTWRGGNWVGKAYPAPRPLYGVEQLAKRPDAPVMIVEGEKCADAAAAALGAYVVLTWAGGAQTVKLSDWTPLRGRNVIIWPDADEPGSSAAALIAEILSKYATRIRIILPDKSDGWDVCDALADGMDAKAITAWAKTRLRQTFPAPEPEAAPEPEPPKTAPEAPQTALVSADADIPISASPLDAGGSAFVSWASMGLDCNEGGLPHPTVANASMILQAHPQMKGHVWYDRFTCKIYHNLRGHDVEWSDDDDVDLTVRIQQSLRLPKFNMALVQAGVGHAARRNSRNSLTDWLGSLKWDGRERLDTWLGDCLGVDRNEYSMAVARNWPISMVARAYVPGCQVDTMPVLEGKMGRGKSSFLAILGRPWYASLPVAFGDKDFLQAIQGNWLIEIPDMTGFSRREHTQILATITIRTDVYRPSYGRRTISHPRVAIFAATSETDDYLQDARGRRRYWPLRCEGIDLDALAMMRDQIFAEAVQKYRAGQKWYEMPESSDEEQMARAAPDLWTDKVIDYATRVWEARTITGPGQRVTSSDILREAIEMKVSNQTDIEKRRVARIMRENGWVQQRDSYGRFWKKIERH